MEKRKRSSDDSNSSSDHNTTATPSENVPSSSGTELLSRENSSRLGELKAFSPGINVSDRTLNLLNMHSSQHYNRGRPPVFLKRSRHHHNHQDSRRNSGNHGQASTSEFQCHRGNRVPPFSRPERIRSIPSVADTDSSDSVKMACGICQKLLMRKPYFPRGTQSSGEPSVVAVLACGHVYHADCLERRTKLEDIHDPSCPLCLICPAETSRSQEQRTDSDF